MVTEKRETTQGTIPRSGNACKMVNIQTNKIEQTVHHLKTKTKTLLKDQKRNQHSKPKPIIKSSALSPSIFSLKPAMKTPTFLVLLHLFLLPIFIQCDDNLINQICKKTPFRNLCIASLEPNRNSTSATDAKGLARIIADCLLENATDNLNYIRNLIKQAPDPQQERALANCAEMYIPVVKYELPQAIEALMKGHYGFASYNMADVGKQADACEKGFSGSAKSPLTDRNKLVRSLSAVAVAIINILGKVF